MNRNNYKHLNNSFQSTDRRERKVTKLVLSKREEHLPPINKRTNSCQYENPEEDNIEYVPDRWSPTGWKYRMKNFRSRYVKLESRNEGCKKPYPYGPNTQVLFLINTERTKYQL